MTKINITKENEAAIIDSLKKFYIDEIKSVGTFYASSKKLGKSCNYIHEAINKNRSIETLREIYLRLHT